MFFIAIWHKKCIKAVGTYPSAIQSDPECYKTHEMCDKAIDTCPYVLISLYFDTVPLISFPDWYVTQEICDKVVSEEPCTLKFCFDKYKTQEKCDKTFDSYLLTLKYIPDWFVISQMIEKLDNADIIWWWCKLWYCYNL